MDFYNQYVLVKESREQVFQLLGKMPTEDFLKPITFDGKSIAHLYVHIANTYQGWLVKFAGQTEAESFDVQQIQNIHDLVALFQKVNEVVEEFIKKTQEQGVFKNSSISQTLELSALKLFTHVITHEFHHKGQVLMLTRQLGHQPMDTDVIRF